MLSDELKKEIKTYPNFPKEGIFFKDMLPIFAKPKLYSRLIEQMASDPIFNQCDAIIAIDARGFLLGSSIAIKAVKPLILARKPGKLPGDLISQSYNLEYGSNCLSIQKDSLDAFKKFAIVDDLLATGGTVSCVSKILETNGRKISGLSVVIELSELNAKANFDFPVRAQIQL
ncbi:adenine phosphoribosyltransferase [Prochlorococcus sp. MIT 1341]|uniref:adenine phosphoribosyltransferase n=1 Tax=Prochlorococcus sp. MIT 1341 TaxID=3096221 RepID=UPI002A7565F6|nr:adenine phosphoribosyltransferase [Prochlorococcus sp. MIT 1341]